MSCPSRTFVGEREGSATPSALSVFFWHTKIFISARFDCQSGVCQCVCLSLALLAADMDCDCATIDSTVCACAARLCGCTDVTQSSTLWRRLDFYRRPAPIEFKHLVGDNGPEESPTSPT